jgi:hypothetical protein
LATALPSVIDLIYKTSSIAVPGLLLPLLISFSSKYQIQAKHASMVMLAGSSASLIWMVLLEMSIGFAEGIEAMLPGILVSLIFTSVFTKRVNYEQ